MKLSECKLLISGIDGFVGFRTAELAIAKGMKVRGLQSSADRSERLQNLGGDVIVGSIKEAVISQKAFQGVDIVIHTAELDEEVGSIQDFREINVDGTINLAQAAKNAGVKTFVHLSSVMVYGFNYPNYVTEDTPLLANNNPYCQTKIEAEEALLKLNTSPYFGIIIIRAGDVYGPGSIPWVIRPLYLMREKLFAYINDGQGVSNHVYIDNLIDAIFLAIEKELHGEIFNITDGKETSWKDYFTCLAEIAGLPVNYPSLPKDELKLLVKLRHQGQKMFGKKADIVPESLDFISRPYAYSIAKAKAMLNYQPKIDLQEGMRRTQEWLQKTDIPHYR
ncbi:NAD-dependent epimerase/dehydratase family protein [Anabaena sp. CCY 9402-a]|uniref:NAD-dependent epimerase/dehydratase family protein n=1 Tax=Anabaena sp. CCY 9402-a TaxID=3103867 RepID=UPI0039C66126